MKPLGNRADIANAQALPVDHRRREKENMADFVAKKREIFLVQMSLDTKRAEIRKLEERALQREEALCKSEQMLEEDALRFDAFLKENDQKVQEAIKRAELEAKAKQDKVHEIKRLNAAITTIRSELNKYEEQLEDCRKYKHFLDALTPPEFFKEQEDKRQARRAARRAKRQAKRDAFAQLVQTAKDLEAAIPVAEAALAEASRRGRTAEEAAANELDAAKQACQDAYNRIPEHPPPPEPENDDSDEEMPMYFERPTQLLDMFAQLEEQNLFLIQNSQETEEALEELKNKYRSTTQLMEEETSTLGSQISELKSAIMREEKKGGELKEKTNEQTDGLLTGQESSLEDLSLKVSEVYNKCGFDYDPSISTIQMLTNIESKLEEYLDVIDEMPPEFVEAAEKQKEKERRARFREEKIEQQRFEQEARVQRSLERAQAPVHKKVGKPLMFRSQPPSRKKKEEVVSINTEEEELQAFLATDF